MGCIYENMVGPNPSLFLDFCHCRISQIARYPQDIAGNDRNLASTRLFNYHCDRAKFSLLLFCVTRLNGPGEYHTLVALEVHR
jgi:hypothetical protein